MKRKRLIIAITVFLAGGIGLAQFLVSNYYRPELEYPGPAIPGLSELACRKAGYAWVQLPGLCGQSKGCGSVCDILTKDAGKDCYSDSQCEGACLCSSNQDAQGFYVGTCSQYVNWTEVSDCPCFTRTKSQNKTEAQDIPYCT